MPNVLKVRLGKIFTIFFFFLFFLWFIDSDSGVVECETYLRKVRGRFCTPLSSAFPDFKKNAISWHTDLLHPPPEFVCKN